MLNARVTQLRRFFPLIVLCLTASQAIASSPNYHESMVAGKDGKLSLQLTNDSDVPITAFLIVHFPSLGIEGRDYYDFYVHPRDQPIASGASITRGLSALKGEESKVHAEVRAVVFKDGSSGGDPVWVNVVLTRRLRLYDRTLALHALLAPLVGTGISREEILAKLRAGQADAEKQLPDDDLRIVDAVAFHGAISTIENNREAPVEIVLKRYLEYLEKRTRVLEYSKPSMEGIRDLPVSIPKPLSDGDLPAELQQAAAAPKRASAAPASSVSSCTVYSTNFEFPPEQLDSCTDSEGNGSLGYTNNKYTSFSNQYFSYYNGATGKSMYKPWSWSPGVNDVSTATGQCVGFYDCDGNWDVFYKGGTATGYAAASAINLNPTVVQQGQSSAPFYWEFDSYPLPTFSDCDECDPYPNNQYNPVSVNAPKTGVVFYFNYACTVTP